MQHSASARCVVQCKGDLLMSVVGNRTMDGIPFPTTPSVNHPYTVPHTPHWHWVHGSLLLSGGALTAQGRGEEGVAHSHCVLGQYCGMGWSGVVARYMKTRGQIIDVAQQWVL